MSKPSQTEIDDVLNRCAESADSGCSTYPGMSYEDGVEAAIRWITEGFDNPFED